LDGTISIIRKNSLETGEWFDVKLQLQFTNGQLTQLTAQRSLSSHKGRISSAYFHRALEPLSYLNIEGKSFHKLNSGSIEDLLPRLEPIAIKEPSKYVNTFPSKFEFILNNHYFTRIQVKRNVITIFFSTDFHNSQKIFDRRMMRAFLPELQASVSKEITFRNILEHDPAHKGLHDEDASSCTHSHIEIEGLKEVTAPVFSSWVSHLQAIEFVDETAALQLSEGFTAFHRKAK
jgi:hypothetical protein